jgi:hypothetical protein
MDELIKELEDALLRELTPNEKIFIKWLHGWEKETIMTCRNLFADLYAAGQNDVELAHQALELGERQD